MALWNQLKTVLLLGGLTALLVGMGRAVGGAAAHLALAFAVVLNVGAYFFSDRLVLAMHRAQPLGPGQMPGLHRMVEQLAQRAGIPKPRLYLVEEPQPNAFATGRNPAHGAVAVTTGLLSLLDERELRGVLAHEIAHIRNRDILVSTIAAVVAAAITHLANMLQWGLLLGFGGGRDDEEEGLSPLGALLLALVAPLAATLVQLGISRTREYLADRTGAELTGDPLGLASALRRIAAATARVPPHVLAEPATASLMIANPFAGLGEGMMRLFSTHPPMAERIARLERLALQMQAEGSPRAEPPIARFGSSF